MSESESEQPEPTMEEILASIRRIISEDGDDVAASEDGEEEAVSDDAPAAEVDEPAEEEAVLELTDIVEDDEDVAELEPEPEVEFEEEPEPEPEPEPETKYEPIPDELEPIEGDGHLVSDAPAEAASNTFAQLSGAMLLQGLTLDDLVREMLKPMLKAWLDANLPQMVERLVEREITRLTGGKPRE